MRSLRRLVIGVLGFAALFGGRAGANIEPIIDPNALPARCWITTGANQANIFLRVCAKTGDDVFGLTPGLLSVDTDRTGSISFLTLPTFRRVMDDGNCHTFHWQVALRGCGDYLFSTDATAETPDGLTLGTGPVSCGRVGVACLLPTHTPTPRLIPTLRDTRTPLPTATPRPALPTPTPRARIIPPTKTPRPRLATPTPRPRIIDPTVTPRPRLPTPTPKPPKELPTLRNTRTPLPTKTPIPPRLDQFSARCIAVNPSSPIVTIYLQIFNNTGTDIFDIVPGELQIDTIGDARVTRVVGPFPKVIDVLLDRHSARFKWNLFTAGTFGQIIIHASATGRTGAGAEVSFANVTTGALECNTINVVN